MLRICTYTHAVCGFDEWLLPDAAAGNIITCWLTASTPTPAGKDVYVPLVEDSSSNMSLLHIGAAEGPPSSCPCLFSALLYAAATPTACVFMHTYTHLPCIHADGMEDLTPAPPFGILEPARHRADGLPREHGALN
jgi:hypothetical protein